MTNILLAKKTIEALIHIGVTEFILCAGARNSPFMFFFEKNSHLQIESFFDERSASFYALGKIQKTNRPVAVITTSGTAVSEALSAMIEAHYTGKPLIIVSADRPKSYRGQGAPQSIEHVGIFSHYVEQTFDVDTLYPEIDLSKISGRKPFHINVCFDEPLIDADIPIINSPIGIIKAENENKNFVDDQKLIQQFISQSNPVIILGQVDLQDVGDVRNFLIQLGCPIYAEAISNLREDFRLQHLLIRHGDYSLNELFHHQICNSVIRIGGVPTIRLWRDLESKLKNVPVLSVTNSGFSGLSRQSIVIKNIKSLNKTFQINAKNQEFQSIVQLDRKLSDVLDSLFTQLPLAETSWINSISKKTIGDRVYLGNSLPIREWDLCAQTQSSYEEMFGNRGANGIDGQISTMFGWSKPQVKQWGVFGDLTTMYDLNSLWATRFMSDINCQIVVINNGGGQIFNRMFRKDIFLNQHHIQFSNWAKMWNWDYIQLTNGEVSELQSNNNIIEILPDAKQTEEFYQELEKQWQILSK